VELSGLVSVPSQGCGTGASLWNGGSWKYLNPTAMSCTYQECSTAGIVDFGLQIQGITPNPYVTMSSYVTPSRERRNFALPERLWINSTYQCQ